MSLLRAVRTVLVLIGGLVVMTAGPAAACSYPIPPPEATSAARADAVFVGTLVSQVNPPDRAAETAREELAREVQRRPPRRQRIDELMRKVAQSSDRAVLTFEVRRVYKGRVGRRQEVVTSWHPSCPPLITGPGPFLVFANNPSPAISSRYQLGWLAPDSMVFGIAVLAGGIAAGLALAAWRARRRPPAD